MPLVFLEIVTFRVVVVGVVVVLMVVSIVVSVVVVSVVVVSVVVSVVMAHIPTGNTRIQQLGLQHWFAKVLHNAAPQLHTSPGHKVREAPQPLGANLRQLLLPTRPTRPSGTLRKWGFC